jgi:hypothetical protein
MAPRRTRAAKVASTVCAPSVSAVIEDVLRRTAQICRELDDLRQVSDYVSRLPDVTAVWFTDPDFVDPENGEPLPLPLRGSRRSLSALVRRIFPREEVSRVVQSLLQSGSVRKRGNRFYAVKNYLSFAEEALLAQVHALDLVRRFLATIQYNVGCRDPEQRFLERTAIITSVAIDALPAIHEEIKREFGPALNRLDTFVRQFQVPEGSQSTTDVGLSAFASEDPLMTPTLVTSVPATRAPRKERSP